MKFQKCFYEKQVSLRIINIKLENSEGNSTEKIAKKGLERKHFQTTTSGMTEIMKTRRLSMSPDKLIDELIEKKFDQK